MRNISLFLISPQCCIFHPILRGKAEAETDSANRSRSETERAGFTLSRIPLWVISGFSGDHIVPRNGQNPVGAG
ncbi:hypothetical protein DUI87_14897 [Hirundo rustica rustica]|uniref:Uncharacterized protein n=1 Tax=Hirundo rustica rustica TaxID=333673 RepID=A0A3M0K657_HIRRU|nr:hypothetical protein DUI87_14897 [Hirundo rustica rustica]